MFINPALFAQQDHEHHYNYEISFGAGIVPVFDENIIAPGFHLHLIKGLGEEGKFGIGPGFEVIIDEHMHYSLSLVGHYTVYKGLIFAYAPGLLLIKEESEKLYRFSQHIELNYEFGIGEFHLGPVAGFGFSTEGYHIMAGIHFGRAF